MNERNVRARDVCLGSTGGKTNSNFNRLLLLVTWVILTIIFCVCIEKIFRVGVVNPSLLRVEEAAAGRLSSQCFSWESRQRGAHLHLYYLWEFEHHNEKCVKDWRLSGSHTHTHAAHSNVNCCSDVSPLILMISHRFGGALCEETDPSL